MKLLNPDQYQNAAERIFLTVRDEIGRVLPQARIEHVGSSSIPGSISKGDIDVCAIVRFDQHAVAIAVLQKIGYVVKADTLRAAELCMLQSPRLDIDLAIQVVAKGSMSEGFVTFCNALRNDPALVQSYNEVKLRDQHLSPAQYREAKSRFIEDALREV